MTWRQFDALWRYKCFEWIGWCWHGLMDSGDNLLILMGACHGQQARVFLQQAFAFNTQAASDNDPTVIVQSLANCFKTFCPCAVDKPAGVHDHRVGTVDLIGDTITFGTKFCDDALAVHQRFRATERNQSDRGYRCCCHRSTHGAELLRFG